jgi:hypothetical protein
MFYWVYLDPQGVVRRAHPGMEFLNAERRAVMRVVFAGTPEFARVALERLHAAGFTFPWC